MDWIFLFYILLFLVAFLYASVGHGGASGYIALMTIFSFNAMDIKSNALIFNIFVASIALFFYLKVEKINWKIAIPILAFSMPLAYLGGSLKIDNSVYKIVLAIVLLVPILRLLGILKENEKSIEVPPMYLLFLSGAIIGFVSGLIGIGGGILLTPLLIYCSWSNLRQASLLSALFIVLNSIAGLLGSKIDLIHQLNNVSTMLILVVTGGILGAYFGVRILHISKLKKILALVLTIAVVKLLITI